MRRLVALGLAVLLPSACDRSPATRAPTDDRYAVRPSGLEGSWVLQALNGVPAQGSLWLRIDGTAFQLEGCGPVGGRVPPTNGPPVLRADGAGPSCPEPAWREHQALTRLLQASPEATIVPKSEGCFGPGLELRAEKQVAVFCPPMPSEG